LVKSVGGAMDDFNSPANSFSILNPLTRLFAPFGRETGKNFQNELNPAFFVAFDV
jgi:hypothetical protein